jgi:hypothetical protein
VICLYEGINRKFLYTYNMSWEIFYGKDVTLAKIIISCMMTSTMTKIYVDVIQHSTHCPSFLFAIYPFPSFVCMPFDWICRKEKHSWMLQEKKNSWAWLNYNIEKTYHPEQEKKDDEGSMTDVSMTYRIKKKKFKISTASVSFILCQLDDIYVLLISYLMAGTDLCIYYYCDINLCLFVFCINQKEKLWFMDFLWDLTIFLWMLCWWWIRF